MQSEARTMRAMLVGVLVALTAAACGPRQVEVRTGTPAQSQVALAVTNNLSQAVNVYVEYGGNEMLIGSVSGNAQQTLAVPNVPSGASVLVRARTQNGQSTYCANRCSQVVLTGTYDFRVP